MFSKWIDESGECRDDFLVGFCREGTHQLQQSELGTGLGHPAYGIRHSRSPAGRNPVVRVVYTESLTIKIWTNMKRLRQSKRKTEVIIWL